MGRSDFLLLGLSTRISFKDNSLFTAFLHFDFRKIGIEITKYCQMFAVFWNTDMEMDLNTGILKIKAAPSVGVTTLFLVSLVFFIGNV